MAYNIGGFGYYPENIVRLKLNYFPPPNSLHPYSVDLHDTKSGLHAGRIIEP
ncbi:Hypothetical predicted protein [Olea europaea subsp. europaea]|uniref:Uncharacterized protein n=1 Tax=Olea europaea subsp. europaea TaxID=158383 RepID=A0A8S0R3T2_OLEEU|nr:Hypothetical predicted protein [Olea europaea subsp. europaea]